MKMERIIRTVVIIIIVACSIWTGTASGQTNTYKFDQNQSTVVRSFFTSDTYTLTGAFQLTVNANSASFDSVDATFSDDPNLQTGDLGELFYMSELVGDVVNDTTIEFELPPGHAVRQSYDIQITLTFQNGHVGLTGQRFPLMLGEPGYTLDAVANIVTIFYVDAVKGNDNNDGLSPETAFATIQKSIDSAQNGDLVIVLPGTYTGYGNRDIDFKGKAITVRSESGPNDCIVDCQAQGRGFYFYSGENVDSILEGLTILNGLITDMGAGIFCAGTSPSIRNCIIRDCSILGTGAGGGISCYGGDPAITNCSIINNNAYEGSGIYLQYSEAAINSCTISGNGNYDSWGGGIYCIGGSPIITDCDVTENYGGKGGGGIYFKNSYPTITDCNFVRNDAEYGGGAGIMCVGCRLTVSRCKFNENTTDNDYSDGGGAVYLIDADGTITDCSFSANETIGGAGAGIWCEDQSKPQISNCSFVSHNDDVISCYNLSNPIIRDCSFTANSGTPIDIERSYPTVSNCEIVDNYMMGVEIKGICRPLIVNCRLTGNGWGGVWISGGANPEIVNCTIADNRKYAGIYCRDRYVNVHNCILWENYLWTGEPNSILLDSATATVTYSDVQGGWPGVGNINTDPKFVDPNGGDYHVMLGSQCINAGDNSAVPPSVMTDLDGNPRIIKGTVDMGAYEFQGLYTLYVDADAPQFGDGKSWATAFRYLQDALFNVIHPTEILVAEGVYKPHLNSYTLRPPSRYDTFQLMNNVTIKGGYAGLSEPNPDTRNISLYVTILSGDMNGDDVGDLHDASRQDNNYHVVTGSGTDATAVLDGFTISGGNAYKNKCSPHDNGGGMYNSYGSPTVVNCTFTKNTASDQCGGGGGGMYNHYSNPTVTNCTFTANEYIIADDDGGGGMCNSHSSPIVTDCVFSDNASNGYGGAMFNYDSNSILTGCMFVNNSSAHKGGAIENLCSNPAINYCMFIDNSTYYGGGGIHNEMSSPTLLGCTFSGNSASAGNSQGGGIYNSYMDDTTLIDCLFKGNSANRGGGMYTYWGTASLVDCNFIENPAVDGGAMFNYKSDLVLTGCTFVGNSAEGGWTVGKGGAVYGELTGLTFIDCSFSENSTAWLGGGIYSRDSSGLTLSGCKFSENFAFDGGGIYSRLDEASLTDCRFERNVAESGGGGLYGNDANLLLTNCRFIANVGSDYHDAPGGGMLQGGGRAKLIDCAFLGNSGSYGGGLYVRYDSISTLAVNCIFTGNTVHEGGGAITTSGGGSPLTLINCTITGNSCDWFDPGGIDAGGEDLTIVNSIIWGNSLNGDFSESSQLDGQNIVISYSCVQGWTGKFGGAGNFGYDPMFIDANGADDIIGTEDDNLRLSFGSPCIGAGDNSAVPPFVLTDLDGNPRIAGNTVDMGAYEFSGPIYVDDDAPNDPGPCDPAVSDPLEDGTEAHPFDTIQEGINAAPEGYTVLVRQGSYSEPGISNSIDFLGKNINLTGAGPADWDVVNNTVIRGYVQFSGTEGPNCKFTGFKIRDIEGAIYGNHTHATISHCNISGNGPCGATVIKDCDGIISNCLITDNTTFFHCGVYPVVFGCNGVIKNCTIANNDSGLSVGTATIENCIIYNNFGSQLAVTNGGTLNISYSNVQGGLEEVVGDGSVEWGPGNIDTDPCFVRLGYWIMDEMKLIEGNYHLRSEGWRWNSESKSWTYDYITSRCIDAGNPGAPLAGELISVPRDPDNFWGVNLRINMGAFGRTSQASMPPHGWTLLADLNNNGTVNFWDFAYQTQDWLTTAPEQPGDLNRDGVVNMIDLAALAENWLQVTEWANQPTAVYITQPPDGLEFCWLTESVLIEANVSGVDGPVVKVEFFVNGDMVGEDNEGTDGWLYVTSFDMGSYTLTAKATDNKGAITTSPPVKIKAVECQ